MDFITHTLIGVGASRLLAPARELRPQLGLAAILGALLPDADSWLYLLGPHYYGLYHRVASHSFVGLTAIGFGAAAIAWGLLRVRNWRRFGWFVSQNLKCGETCFKDEKDEAAGFDFEIPRARFCLLLAAALASAYLHWCFDAITGFGNVTPLWPWHSHDVSLRAVSSFDWVIFTTALTWHLLIRQLDLPRRPETLVTIAYFAAVSVYVAARWSWSEPAFI